MSGSVFQELLEVETFLVSHASYIAKVSRSAVYISRSSINESDWLAVVEEERSLC